MSRFEPTYHRKNGPERTDAGRSVPSEDTERPDRPGTAGRAERDPGHRPDDRLRSAKENPDDLLDGRYGEVETKYLNIKGEKVELTVQVGRIWIEIEGPEVVEKIRTAGEKALPFPFEMYKDVCIRTQKTVTDYARKGGKVDDISIGMFDPKDRRTQACCASKPYDDRHEQA